MAERPSWDGANTDPLVRVTPAETRNDDDVTVQAGRKYALLGASVAALLWVAIRGALNHWWPLPVATLVLAVVGTCVVGVVSKYEEKRFRAAAFTPRARLLSNVYFVVLIAVAVLIVPDNYARFQSAFFFGQIRTGCRTPVAEQRPSPATGDRAKCWYRLFRSSGSVSYHLGA